MEILFVLPGRHSNEKPEKIEPPTSKNEQVNIISSTDDVEVYSTSTKINTTPTSRPQPPKTQEKEPEIGEEQLNDPEDAVIEIGTSCKRKSCSHQFDGNKDSTCIFHSGEPIFHEGSKGWSCCSRKVLEFDEFLKIKGCKTGKHRFTNPTKVIFSSSFFFLFFFLFSSFFFSFFSFLSFFFSMNFFI